VRFFVLAYTELYMYRSSFKEIASKLSAAGHARSSSTQRWPYKNYGVAVIRQFLHPASRVMQIDFIFGKNRIFVVV